MPTYLKPTINGNCGKDKSFWGGRDVECTPTQPSSPITWSTEHGENAFYMRSVPFPFPCQTCALVPCSDMLYALWTQSLLYIYGTRDVQYSQTLQALGIRHATYIRTCTHRNTISLLYKYSTYWENIHLILYSTRVYILKILEIIVILLLTYNVIPL